MGMDVIFILGASAAFLTTLGFFPQVIKAHRTKHTKDLSLIMYLFLCAGLILWIAYGLLLKQTPIIAANAVTLVLCLYIVFLKVKYG
jgi:MtN3 and saliva related transmembrane protein